MRYDSTTGLPREQITDLVARVSQVLDSRSHPSRDPAAGRVCWLRRPVAKQRNPVPRGSQGPACRVVPGTVGLQATRLLSCAAAAFTGHVAAGFYGLDTIMLEAVLRALAGEPRTDGAGRLDPTAFGRILGMDRAPVSRTLRRRRHHDIAESDKVPDQLELMAHAHVTRTQGPFAGPIAIYYAD